MATAVKLTADLRERAGKGVARATRSNGQVPCVIYGGKEAPMMISIAERAVERHVNTSTFLTRMFDIEVGGVTHNVLPRDVQLHPVSDRPIHIDFLRINKDSVITVAVPVEFIKMEASPGLKRGGVLNIVHHEIELRCKPANIPAHLTIDLTGLEIGASIYLSAITLPEGVSFVTHEKDYTIATIAAPSALRGKEEEADAAAATAASAEGAAATATAAGATPAADTAKPAAKPAAK